MALHLFKKTKQLDYERTYPAPLATVWRAWTDPDLLRQWWAPEHATVTDCDVDLRDAASRIAADAADAPGFDGLTTIIDGFCGAAPAAEDRAPRVSRRSYDIRGASTI